MSGHIPTCDSARSWRLYSAASLGHQAADIMTPTQSHYADAERASLFPIQIMASARLGSDKYQFQSDWFDSTRVRIH